MDNDVNDVKHTTDLYRLVAWVHARRKPLIWISAAVVAVVAVVVFPSGLLVAGWAEVDGEGVGVVGVEVGGPAGAAHQSGQAEVSFAPGVAGGAIVGDEDGAAGHPGPVAEGAGL